MSCGFGALAQCVSSVAPLNLVNSKEDGIDRQTLNADTRVCTPIEDILELKRDEEGYGEREKGRERGRGGFNQGMKFNCLMLLLDLW